MMFEDNLKSEKKSQDSALSKAEKNLNKIEKNEKDKTAKQQAKEKKIEAKEGEKIAKDKTKLKEEKKGSKGYSKAQKSLEKEQAKLAKDKTNNQKALRKIQDGEKKDRAKNDQKLVDAMDKAHDKQFDVNGDAKEHLNGFQKFTKAMESVVPGVLSAIPGAADIALGPEAGVAADVGVGLAEQGIDKLFDKADGGETMKAETGQQAQQAMDHRGQDMQAYEAMEQRATKGAKGKRDLGVELEKRVLDAELHRAWARLMAREARGW